jgi:hypothetical protein
MRKRLVFLVTVTFLYAAAGGQNKRREDSLITVFFNLKAITNDATKNGLIKALAQFSKEKEFHKEHVVSKGESLNTIIRDEYGLLSEKFAGTYMSLVKDLKQINNLSTNILQPNQIIRIPEAPTISKHVAASNEIMQLYDLTSMTSQNVSVDSFFEANKIETVVNTYNQAAKIISYIVDSEDYTLLFNKFSQRLLDSLVKGALYVKVGQGDIRAHFSDSSDKKDLDNFTPSEVDSERLDLSQIPMNNFDTLILVDYFYRKDSCGHGRKVKSVVKNIFHQFHLDELMTHVREVPINFYQNQKFAKIFLTDFYSDPIFQREEYRLIANNTRSLIDKLSSDKEVPTECPDCIPEIYLNAIMKYYYLKTPDVISTSFWANASQSPVPDYKTQSKTNLVTAGSDDINSFVETLSERNGPGNGELTEIVQPIRSYFDSKKYGCLIVGCETKPGFFYGMSSKDGLGVTAIGKGYNWTSEDKCLLPDDLGTSFSTPEISAKLFIAKGYWRSLGYKEASEISAEEAEKILILSSVLNQNYVDHFASGGRISLKKLIHPTGFYLVDSASNLVKVDSIQEANVKYRDQNKKLRIPPLDNTRSFWGLYRLGDTWYVYDDELSQRWIPVQPNSLQLKLTIHGETETIASYEEFKKRYTQFIILKN